jgi:hypothetical protein
MRLEMRSDPTLSFQGAQMPRVSAAIGRGRPFVSRALQPQLPDSCMTEHGEILSLWMGFSAGQNPFAPQ